MEKTRNLVNVGRYMAAIRRRARLVVLSEQLRELQDELAKTGGLEEQVERIRGMRELLRDL
tara:strand:- start:386 stop:568 length:183 start_codon:yes stop_codon:yes gene_type:complete